MTLVRDEYFDGGRPLGQDETWAIRQIDRRSTAVSTP
jgi:hypothetical protein